MTLADVQEPWQMSADALVASVIPLLLEEIPPSQWTAKQRSTLADAETLIDCLGQTGKQSDADYREDILVGLEISSLPQHQTPTLPLRRKSLRTSGSRRWPSGTWTRLPASQHQATSSSVSSSRT